MKQFEFDDDTMLEFRVLRLWHWRKLVKNLSDMRRHEANGAVVNAERSKSKLQFHTTKVELLNKLFDVNAGDTAAHDEYLTKDLQ